MTTAELKESLFKDIHRIDDEKQLEFLKLFIENKFLRNKEPKLTEEQKQRLEISLKEAEQGLFITNDELNAEIDKWLQE
ncbi:MAG TPA: hypothetical protein PK605_12730 [Ignavibacteria bacterium]|nr:hypothetical protein [Bacteroidota bacterium]HRE11555.1 hypothetical protein [Ignavibacteria bacterium]HRF65731.1 hypothetical protein [Ignavibacteria bacterium]HRJ05258.1 hypothetical protein [Ignavibacteria bacterium]HRJ85487.1 hypothetical protein [Ignavibacteria bacterium]